MVIAKTWHLLPYTSVWQGPGTAQGGCMHTLHAYHSGLTECSPCHCTARQAQNNQEALLPARPHAEHSSLHLTHRRRKRLHVSDHIWICRHVRIQFLSFSQILLLLQRATGMAAGPQRAWHVRLLGDDLEARKSQSQHGSCIMAWVEAEAAPCSVSGWPVTAEGVH